MATVFERARAHIAGHTPIYEAEHRLLHRDGSVRWFIARGCATRDGEGRAVSLAGTATDITERKRSEEALRQAEEINKRIVESTTDCLKILDLDGRLIHVNREGLRLLEIDDATAVLHRPLVEFFEGVVRQAAEEAVAAARGGGGGQFQGRLQAPSGITRWWDVLVTPITDRNGAVVQMLAVSRDITERRQGEAFRAVRQQMLEMIASGNALPEVLDCLVRVVEQQSDGMSCSALVLDDDSVTIRHAAAPSLPPDYVRAIDGMRIGPHSGSCGTAMFLGKRVIVTDILTDPLWEEYRAAARMSGQRACWSTPILSAQQRILGSSRCTLSNRERRATTSSPDRRRGRRCAHCNRAASGATSLAAERGAQSGDPECDTGLDVPDDRRRRFRRLSRQGRFAVVRAPVAIPRQEHQGRDAGTRQRPAASSLGRVRTAEEPEKVEYALNIDGAERFYEARVVRCDGDKILSIVRDVTEQKSAQVEAEAQRLELAHLSRVAVLGELTGALAHELSQPLTAVLSNAQAARAFMDREPIDVPTYEPPSTTSSTTTDGPARSSNGCARSCGSKPPCFSRST